MAERNEMLNLSNDEYKKYIDDERQERKRLVITNYEGDFNAADQMKQLATIEKETTPEDALYRHIETLRRGKDVSKSDKELAEFCVEKVKKDYIQLKSINDSYEICSVLGIKYKDYSALGGNELSVFLSTNYGKITPEVYEIMLNNLEFNANAYVKSIKQNVNENERVGIISGPAKVIGKVTGVEAKSLVDIVSSIASVNGCELTNDKETPEM
ncbi:MAG: hypothetical protein E7361_03415 [Clostridiales bacterium]|nr:hypothetical protein [Clostridiales bacterium]